jgi:hypothetical protein
MILALKPGLRNQAMLRVAELTPPLRAIPGRRAVARMKISFTTKEYARLLELAHLGLWVAGSRPEDPATMPARYEELAQKVFALAEPLGCADLVEADPNGGYFPTEKLTEGPARKKLETFIEDAFWSELATRLAARDLRAEVGAAASGAEELAPEHEEKLAAGEDAYWREFEAHGVDHLVVLRGGRG